MLAKFIRGLSESDETDPFFVCGGLNINAVRFDLELERAKEKMDCGVSAFLTQPVLSERAALNLEQARKTLGGAKLIGRVCFRWSARKTPVFYKAKCMASRWTTSLCALMRDLTASRGEALAVRLCEAAAKRIAPFTDGYYIMTPFQRVGLVCRVMRATRNLAE